MLIRTLRVLAITAIFASFAIADDGPQLADLDLQQLMQVQFYTASKHAQDESETPASVTVVTRADIHAYGYRTLADILQGVRGFWVNTDRNYSYLGVLGFARPGDYNTRILLLINGHRLNDNIYDQAMIGTEFPLDVDLIERIEIVRGPSSSLYGTDAFFGVVNVITQSPPLSPRVDVSVEAATQFTRKTRVTVGLPELLDGALFSASMYRSDGNSRLFFPEFNDPATNNGVAQGVDGDRYGSAFAQIHWRHFQLDGLLGSREKIIPTASFGDLFNDSGSRTTDTHGYGEVSYHRDFASGLQVMSRGFYDRYLFHGTYAFMDGTRMVEYDSGRGDWVGTETTLSRPLGHRNTITAGTELRYNLHQDQGVTVLSDVVMDDHRTSTVFAFYGQDELRVTSRFTINAGLRLDHYSTFGSALSPRAAAILRLNQKTIVKYAYGHAFRAPNAYEMYYHDGANQEVNLGLQPETIESHNLALERTLTPVFHLVVEAFYNSLNNLVDERLDSSSGLYHFVNVNSAQGKGLEFQLDAQHHAWHGELSYTVQRTIDGQTRELLANSPMHLAKMKLQIPLPFVLRASAELDYAGPQLTYTDVRIPNALTTNVTLSTRKPLLGFDFSASCYNLFDRRNYDPVPPSMQQSRLLMDGRGARIQVTRRFPRE